jgi:hypothetical protein
MDEPVFVGGSRHLKFCGRAFSVPKFKPSKNDVLVAAHTLLWFMHSAYREKPSKSQ